MLGKKAAKYNRRGGRGKKKRELSIIKTRERWERVLQVQALLRAAGTLISPTGGFYRLQPPSDTRLVVKISDAPWAGERARPERAVNVCRLIEHIHVRADTHTHTHTHQRSSSSASTHVHARTAYVRNGKRKTSVGKIDFFLSLFSSIRSSNNFRIFWIFGSVKRKGDGILERPRVIARFEIILGERDREM